MQYVYLIVSIFAIDIIAYTAIKEIRRQDKSIRLKEGIIKEKAEHEKYLQEVIDVLVKENRELKKRIREYGSSKNYRKKRNKAKEQKACKIRKK